MKKKPKKVWKTLLKSGKKAIKKQGLNGKIQKVIYAVFELNNDMRFEFPFYQRMLEYSNGENREFCTICARLESVQDIEDINKLFFDKKIISEIKFFLRY